MRTLLALCGVIFLVVILDCLTAFSAPLNGMFPSGGMGYEGKIVLGLVAFCILAIGVLRLVTIVMLTRTGPVGHWIGMAAIRMMTRSRPGMVREMAVRWTWQTATGRKLKSVATIARRARGIETVRKANEPARALPDNVVPMRRAA